jgi:hypothetical protein
MSAVLETAMHDAGAAEQIPQLRAQAEAQQKQAQTSELAACEARTKAEQLDAAALREESALGLALRNRPGLASPQRIVEYVVTLLVLTVIPLVTYGNLGDVGRLDAIILVLVAFAVAVVSVVTYLVSEKFLWLGVVAFVSVGLYTGCATYFRTIKNPKVEPAAALRGDRSPVMGFFIAETANVLYIGTFRADGIQPRLLIVPRSQVTDLAVGPLLDPHTARERAIDLAKFECRQRIEQHGKGAKPGNACTKSQETALNALRPDSRTS